MGPPPPPPPPPGNGYGPPPPPPPGGSSLTGGFKIVPGLGNALHEMKRKISGVEETPACAEGTASEDTRKTSTPTGSSRPKSWHGSQVPGKPAINRAIISEMQLKLAKRRDKVDKEAYVVETPESALPPTGHKPRPLSCTTDVNRKSSTPLSRGWTPPVDYGPRRMSKDSGRDSWTPTSDYDPQRKISVDYSQYRKVSVDQERKEELCLAKAVRKSSVKMLGRASPSIFEPNTETVIQPMKETSQPFENIPPPSPVVMRYWKQCSSTADDTIDTNNEADDDDNIGQSTESTWKTDALEGEITEFPSIKNKIANMEEEAKTKMFVVPDVKSKMRQGAPAAGWMQARSKLQTQLDSLITKTSAKMTKYGNVHAIETKEFVKESSSESQNLNDAHSDREESPKAHKLSMNSNIKSLIKSVANEIQKSFSAKNIPVMGGCDEDYIDDEENKMDNPAESNDSDKSDYWRNLNKVIRTHPQNIDMEPPLDFDYNEPLVENNKEETKDKMVDYIPKSNPIPDVEEPVDFESTPIVLDASFARSKAKLIRKSSTERRLPASVLAKKKAAEKLKEILNIKNEASAEKPNVIEKIKKELIDASLQVDMSNTEYDLENLDDEQKADLIAKQISKMDSSYVMKLLKQIEKGILDISIPMLMPFLSLQVRMKLGTNIFKGLEPHNKKKVVKENFINDMIEDITDIALLQEVIERTQEKLNILSPPKEVEEEVTCNNINNYFNIENDTFELPSAPARNISPIQEESLLITTIAHEETSDCLESSKKENTPEISDKEDTEVIQDQPIKTEIKSAQSDPDTKKSDDEGCPSSECESSSDEDKEEPCDLKEEESVKSEKTDEDEGLGKEQPITCGEEKEPELKEENNPKEGNEKLIKQRILNIIENAKTIDQKRTVRNFGRTFEFQNMQLKPTVPNDRRPAKAKRMDNMWNQVTAAKQNIQVNNGPAVPKPKVPWTMKKNPQPLKKETDKEVNDFDKCRNTLNSANGKQVQSVGKDIKTAQKITTQSKTESFAEEVKEKVVIVDIIETPKTITKEFVECEKTIVGIESVIKENSNIKEPTNIADNHTNAETIITQENETSTDVTTGKTTTEEVKHLEEGTSSDCSTLSSVRVSRDHSPVEKSETDISTKNEWEPSDEDKDQKEIIKTKLNNIETPQAIKVEESKNEVKEVPITPTVRRRGDTFTVVLPCKPPPPPMSRPPPPPMSPPVPVAKVKELEMENKLVIELKGKESESETESDDEEEEESEWEWESEEESEEESECEVKKEGWENIMSSSNGPTTFKAEYSVQVGGK